MSDGNADGWLLPGGRLARLLVCVAALLSAAQLSNELGAQVAGVSPPSLSVEWWILLVAGIVLLLPASNAALSVRRLGVVAAALGATCLPLSTLFESCAGHSGHTFSLFRPSAPRAVEKMVTVKGLRIPSRRELSRIADRRRDVGLELVGFLNAPRAGTYELSYVCDDECSIVVGAESRERLRGAGSITLELDEGTHPLTIRYCQRRGPSSFALGWNRPGVFELLPMYRFVGNEREAVDAHALRAEHRRAALALTLASVWSFVFLAMTARLSERLWSNKRRAVALVVFATAIFLIAVIGWTPSVSALWLVIALLVLSLGWLRIAKTMGSPPLPFELVAVMLAGLSFVVLASYHVGILNGPRYWKWDWRHLDPRGLFTAMGLAFVPFIVAQLIRLLRQRWSLAVELVLMMVTMVGIQIGARTVKTALFRDGMVAEIVNPIATGQFTDAASFTTIRDWLGSIPERMEDFHMHAQNKPPGNVLYFVVFRKLFGNRLDAAYASGVTLLLLASLAIPLTYWFAWTLSRDDALAFTSASLMALAPGLCFFSPRTDQFSPLLGCLLVATWILALGSGSRRYPVAFGLALSLVLFMNYTALVLGAFLGGYTVLHVVESPRSRLRPTVVAVFTSLATVVVVYTVLWATTGYDALRTFFTAVRLQYEMLPRILRPYPETVWYDLADFALGVGWTTVMLAVTYFAVTLVQGDNRTAARPSRLAVAGLVVAQLLIVAVTALLPGEAARVWLALYPLMALVAAFGLSRWRRGPAMLAYALHFLVLVTLYQNMAMGQ